MPLPLRLLSCCSLLTLSACSTVQPPNQSDHIHTEPVTNPQLMLSGVMQITRNGMVLTPCNSTKTIEVQVNSKQREQINNSAPKANGSAYVELSGDLTPPQNLINGDAHMARLMVKHINYLNTETTTCPTSTHNTKALGNEPFWSANVSQTNMTFSLQGEKPQILPITNVEQQSMQHVYKVQQGEVTLSSAWCRDTMSDNLYGWQAILQLNNKQYKGCALLSNQPTDTSWVGEYATAKAQQSWHTQLQLNSDHSAVTTYQDENGQPSVIERGYWQQFRANEVTVTMTRHQKQRLISQRVYQRKDNRITALQESVSGLTYPIANGGLTLLKSATTNNSTSINSLHDAKANSNNVTSSTEFVASIDTAIRNYITSSNNSIVSTRYHWLTYDLNHDGQKELLVQLNWCGSGGCTMLIFTQDNTTEKPTWKFNSRITQVRNPIYLGTQQSQGWQDLIFSVSGGGQTPSTTKLEFNGQKYPLNPTVAPSVSASEISSTALFSDDPIVSQTGIKL